MRSMFWVSLQSFCSHELSVKLNFVMLQVLVRQQEKSLNYFSPSAFN